MSDAGETKEERALVRRQTWQGGRVSQAEHAQLETEFWRDSTAEERLAAVWSMAEQVWSNEHPGERPLGFARSAFGIRKREG